MGYKKQSKVGSEEDEKEEKEINVVALFMF